MTNQLVNLINNLILEKGIPKYSKDWEPLKLEDLDKEDFLKTILLKLRKYHKHCNILTSSIQTKFINNDLENLRISFGIRI